MNRTRFTERKVAGGTVRVSEYAGLSRRQRYSEQAHWRLRNKATGRDWLVCNGPGRFHGGTPSNLFTRHGGGPRIR